MGLTSSKITTKTKKSKKSKTSKTGKITQKAQTSEKDIVPKRLSTVVNKKIPIKIALENTEGLNNHQSHSVQHLEIRKKIIRKPKPLKKEISIIHLKPNKEKKGKEFKQEIAALENNTPKILKRQVKPKSGKITKIESSDKKQELINENNEDEEYMSHTHRAYFHKILSDGKIQLLEGIKKTIRQMQNDSVSFSDPNDKASQEEEFSLELHTRSRDQKAIMDIEKALVRLKHNDYGYCDACGIEIGLKRLQARPTANLCIDCKTVEEVIEKTSFY